jgi:hypothetical protein
MVSAILESFARLLDRPEARRDSELVRTEGSGDMSTTEIGIIKLSARSKNKLLGVAAASGLLAASLGGAPTANAWCVNFSGLNLGSGCTASFGSIAIVLGPDTSTAVAGDPSVFSLFNIAISVGGTATHPTETFAGVGDANGLPNIGNVAFATAGSGAEAYGLINLAASLGGSTSGLSSAGVGNSTLNLGSNNVVVASGFVNNSTVLFSDDNFVTALNPVNVTGLLSGFNVAFSIFGGGNEVAAGFSLDIPPINEGSGPLSIAGAIGVTAQTVRNTNSGIELRTPFNVSAVAPSVLAAGNKVAPTTFTAGSVNRAGSQLSGSLKKASKQFSSSLNSLNKKVADTVSKVTKGTKAGAASTSRISGGSS